MQVTGGLFSHEDAEQRQADCVGENGPADLALTVNKKQQERSKDGHDDNCEVGKGGGSGEGEGAAGQHERMDGSVRQNECTRSWWRTDDDISWICRDVFPHKRL